MFHKLAQKADTRTPEEKPLRVLLVDDEALSRARLRRLLERQPVEFEIVGEASDGNSALEQYQRWQPQVVFLDIQMPGPDGLEVARQLLQEANPPLVVFLTACIEQVSEASDLCAFDYLLKPLRMEHLKVTLGRLQENTIQGRDWRTSSALIEGLLSERFQNARKPRPREIAC